MEIFKNSKFVASTNREIASQPQSRTQVLAVPWKTETPLWPGDHGELVITVVKGRRVIKTGTTADDIEAGDQVCLVAGDEFALLPVKPRASFVVQRYLGALRERSLCDQNDRRY